MRRGWKSNCVPMVPAEKSAPANVTPTRAMARARIIVMASRSLV